MTSRRTQPGRDGRCTAGCAVRATTRVMLGWRSSAPPPPRQEGGRRRRPADALIVGDTEEETRRASRILEALLAELGLQWAPHKRRGPARVIEFLGMLICNSPRAPRCIGLTRRRQEALRARLDEWLARRPRPGGPSQVIAEPRELAVLLAHLVFASQVMPHGRVYTCRVCSRHSPASRSSGGEAPCACARRGLAGDVYWRPLLARPGLVGPAVGDDLTAAAACW